jgi:hypothetical protein
MFTHGTGIRLSESKKTPLNCKRLVSFLIWEFAVTPISNKKKNKIARFTFTKILMDAL